MTALLFLILGAGLGAGGTFLALRHTVGIRRETLTRLALQNAAALRADTEKDLAEAGPMALVAVAHKLAAYRVDALGPNALVPVRLLDQAAAALAEGTGEHPVVTEVTRWSLAYIRDHYQVPAWSGRRVVVDGKPGVIVGARDAHLRVRFDHGMVMNAHPTWRVEYVAEAGLDPEVTP